MTSPTSPSARYLGGVSGPTNPAIVRHAPPIRRSAAVWPRCPSPCHAITYRHTAAAAVHSGHRHRAMYPSDPASTGVATVPSHVKKLAPAPPRSVTIPTPTTIAAAGPIRPSSAWRRSVDSRPTAGITTSAPWARQSEMYQGIRNTRGAYPATLGNWFDGSAFGGTKCRSDERLSDHSTRRGQGQLRGHRRARRVPAADRRSGLRAAGGHLHPGSAPLRLRAGHRPLSRAHRGALSGHRRCADDALRRRRAARHRSERRACLGRHPAVAPQRGRRACRRCGPSRCSAATATPPRSTISGNPAQTPRRRGRRDRLFDVPTEVVPPEWQHRPVQNGPVRRR